MDPEVAHQRAQIAANTRWAGETDRTAATAGLRAGFFAKLSREARERLGPDATDEQVARAADSALKAHYARMRLRSLQARRKAADERRQAMADAILSEPGTDESERADGAA
jgi:hypothetical protein